MVNEGRGLLFRRTDGKYLVYVPVYLAEDSMFPFKDFSRGRRGGNNSIDLKVSFKSGEDKIIVEKWKAKAKE